MMLGRYRQQPGEKRKRGLDYTDFLEEGEEISNVTATVTPEEENADDSFEITNIIIDPEEGTEFAYFAEGGRAGVTYAVEFTVSTTGGQRRQDTVEFDIEEDE